MKYTIGLDFGTHQTKCCVEERENSYQKFSFVKFMNQNGMEEYRLPSVIKLNSKNRLEYGFFKSQPTDKIYRYFKQATFNPVGSPWYETIQADYFSVWYLTYLIFCLKEKYGEYFNINIGIPTDSVSFRRKKLQAVGLLSSAYKLAEDVFSGHKDSFLNATLQELMHCTTIIPGTEQLRKEFGINAFPEAWACLRPMLKSRRLSHLNLMVDIGGGTTDISLFSVDKSTVKLFYYNSINKGLNFLTKTMIKMENRIPVFSTDLLDKSKLQIYENDIKLSLNSFFSKLEMEFLKYKLPLSDLQNAISYKPSLYTGGGSVFTALRKPYQYFSDIRLVSTNEWQLQLIEKFNGMEKLCPILSTAYGLVISSDDNSIQPEQNLSNLFVNLRGVAETRKEIQNSTPQPKSDYHRNWMDKDYGVLSLGGWGSSYRKKKHK